MVGIAFIAAKQGADRIAFQTFLVALCEQGLQLFAFGHLRFFVMFHRRCAGCGKRLGSGDAADGEQAGADEKGEWFLDHIGFLSKTVMSS